MQETWLEGYYAVPSWCAYRRATCHSTNNNVEGRHHRVNGKTGGKSHGVYTLMSLLKRESDLVDVTVQLVSFRRLTKGQKMAAPTTQGLIFRLWAAFENREKSQSPQELLRSYSHINENISAHQLWFKLCRSVPDKRTLNDWIILWYIAVKHILMRNILLFCTYTVHVFNLINLDYMYLWIFDLFLFSNHKFHLGKTKEKM